MPASLRMATLFPDAAILPSRPADPFKEVLMEEKVSDYGMRHQLWATKEREEERREGEEDIRYSQ
jgi:hypothetical protein